MSLGSAVSSPSGVWGTALIAKCIHGGHKCRLVPVISRFDSAQPFDAIGGTPVEKAGLNRTAEMDSNTGKTYRNP